MEGCGKLAQESEKLERELAAMTRQRNEWRCSAKLYHSELRDLAEGKKVETQLGFEVEKRIARLTKERDELRICFSEASHNAGPAFVAHEELRNVTTERNALRAQVAELTRQRDHAIQMHALRGNAMLLLENPEVSQELRAQVATLRAENSTIRDECAQDYRDQNDEIAELLAACAVKDLALKEALSECRDYSDKHPFIKRVSDALSSSPGAPLLAAVEEAAQALEVFQRAAILRNAFVQDAQRALAPYRTK